MDANRYATKKTIAQGMLDIALLTANASQLKYILQVGEKHEFYTLMLTLISISIILQVSTFSLSFSRLTTKSLRSYAICVWVCISAHVSNLTRSGFNAPLTHW